MSSSTSNMTIGAFIALAVRRIHIANSFDVEHARYAIDRRVDKLIGSCYSPMRKMTLNSYYGKFITTRGL